MERNNEFYRAVVVFDCVTHNRYRAYESNTFDDVEIAFKEMEKALLQRASKDWVLTLEKHIGMKYTQIIRYRSPTENVKSPLF